MNFETLFFSLRNKRRRKGKGSVDDFTFACELDYRFFSSLFFILEKNFYILSFFILEKNYHWTGRVRNFLSKLTRSRNIFYSWNEREVKNNETKAAYKSKNKFLRISNPSNYSIQSPSDFYLLSFDKNRKKERKKLYVCLLHVVFRKLWQLTVRVKRQRNWKEWTRNEYSFLGEVSPGCGVTSGEKRDLWRGGVKRK